MPSTRSTRSSKWTSPRTAVQASGSKAFDSWQAVSAKLSSFFRLGIDASRRPVHKRLVEIRPVGTGRQLRAKVRQELVLPRPLRRPGLVEELPCQVRVPAINQLQHV